VAENDKKKSEMPLTDKYLKRLLSFNEEGKLPHQQISSNRES
jgi:hypothetical protein